MKITVEQVRETIAEMFALGATHAAIGISEMARVEGTEVPIGWWLHEVTDFWLPPNYIELRADEPGGWRL